VTTRLPVLRRLPLVDEARAIDRHARPIYAVWELTLRCDLACRHCGSRAGRARPNELDTGEALDLVRQMAELGVKEVTLIGGEAYLRPDWLRVVAAIREHGMFATMTTGGRGVTPEVARAAFDAGLEGAGVSLDGLAETHDEVRGVRGSFESARSAMRNLAEAGVPVSVNTQIHKKSAHEMEALLDVLVAHQAFAWQVALTVPMGRSADRPELLLEPYDLDALFPVLARVAERCRASGVRFTRGNNVGYFGPFEEIFARHMAGDYACGCGAGRSLLGIEADGTIKGCPSLQTDTWSGGNVRESSLRDIWERGRAMQSLRDPPKLWGFCETCYYGPECRGGCTWTADAVLGRPGNNPYCHHRVIELKARGLRERIVRTAGAPGLPFDRATFELVLEPWQS
jgi:radical SAM protein with 4Fe4S-binding SPASM domain